MKKYKMLFLLLPILTIFSCSPNNEIMTKCPKGAPSLLFYNQGNNTNFYTFDGAPQIVAEFQQNKYDVLVVDATSGLNQIEKFKYTTPFRFAKLLTNGNLYLASLKHNVNNEYPKDNEKVLSFGNESTIPHLVTAKLATSWSISNVEYLTDVSNVLAKAKYDLNKQTEDMNDYYIIAEPALTSLEASAKESSKTLTYKKLTDPTLFNYDIPQAALFINKETYKSKKDKFNKYLTELNERINICINNPDIFKTSLDKYGDDNKVVERFGFKSSIARKVQLEHNNGFAIYPSENKFTYEKMNEFMIKVGQSKQYDGSYFIDVD